MRQDAFGISRAKAPWSDAPRDGGYVRPVHFPDPPEEIAICERCPLPECRMGADSCPLARRKRGTGKTIAGDVDNRSTIAPEHRALMDKIYTMVLNGGTDGWIASELGIPRGRVKYWRKKLVQEGKLC